MQWNRRRWCGGNLGLVAGVAGLPLAGVAADGAKVHSTDKFGTPWRPFSAQSPWNCRPIRPVLGNWEIPRDSYFPTVELGRYSTGVFIGSDDDKPMRVQGLPGEKGLWDPDAEAHRPDIVIPRWPADTLPATGTDGHADIVDPRAGMIHSFFKLKSIDGEWRAKQYAWTRLDGRGWGDPAHYFQGARAAAVPTMGGLIRTHEMTDGDTMFRHALSMSLAFSGLKANPGYVFPATSADDRLNANTGEIPEGALLMLPPDFDTRSLANDKLRKIAETLKVYGAYVVDRNVGTPFAIYAEIGSGARPHSSAWDNRVAGDLDRMRSALRQVMSTAGFLDGHGQPVELMQPLNLLSMRGGWRIERGEAQVRYDTWQQAVLLEQAKSDTVISCGSNRNISMVSWAKPVAGRNYRLTARAGNQARLRLQLNAGSGVAWDSGELADGKSVEFRWPEAVTRARLVARTMADGDSWVGADLRQVSA